MKKSKPLKKINIWASIIIGFGIFLLVKPLIANAETWRDLISDSNILVDTESDTNNYRQIVIRNNNGDKYQLTEENTTHANPVHDGNYIVWMAIVENYWQIFLYDIRAKNYIQLTTGGQNNVNPRISGEKIVWEGQVNDVWQIFLFDGLRIIQLTSGDYPKQDPAIENDNVVFSQKNDEKNSWDLYLYNTQNKMAEKIPTESSIRNAEIKNNFVYWKSLDNSILTTYEYSISDKSINKKQQDQEKIENTAKDNILNQSEDEIITHLSVEDIKKELESINDDFEIDESTSSTNQIPQINTPETSQSTSSSQ